MNSNRRGKKPTTNHNPLKAFCDFCTISSQQLSLTSFLKSLSLTSEQREPQPSISQCRVCCRSLCQSCSELNMNIECYECQLKGTCQFCIKKM